jgi:hypothetical protein
MRVSQLNPIAQFDPFQLINHVPKTLNDLLLVQMLGTHFGPRHGWSSVEPRASKQARIRSPPIEGGEHTTPGVTSGREVRGLTSMAWDA